MQFSGNKSTSRRCSEFRSTFRLYEAVADLKCLGLYLGRRRLLVVLVMGIALKYPALGGPLVVNCPQTAAGLVAFLAFLVANKSNTDAMGRK